LNKKHLSFVLCLLAKVENGFWVNCRISELHCFDPVFFPPSRLALIERKDGECSQAQLVLLKSVASRKKYIVYISRLEKTRL
jgi:hypothetical protein